MAEIKFIQPERLPKPAAYTQVVTARGGKTIYIAGQVAYNAEGQFIGRGDLRAQTTQVFENIQIALAAAGATFDDLVKMTTYIVNYKPEDRSILLEVRNQYLSAEAPPTTTLLGVQSLALSDFLIEIDAIAVVS